MSSVTAYIDVPEGCTAAGVTRAKVVWEKHTPRLWAYVIHMEDGQELRSAIGSTSKVKAAALARRRMLRLRAEMLK